MKPAFKIFVAIIILVALFAQITTDDDHREVEDGKRKYCRRENVLNIEKRQAVIKSAAKCKTIGRKYSSEIEMKISNTPLPIAVLKSKLESEAKNGSKIEQEVEIKLTFDQIVEYKEKNNVEGYQPDEDEAVKTYYLSSEKNKHNSQFMWSDYKNIVTSVGNSTVNSIITSLPRFSGDSIGVMEIGIQITNNEISSKINGANAKRLIVTPNSLKINLTMSNIVYQDPQSTGLAISGLLLIKGELKKKAKQMASSNEYRVDDASDDQDVVNIEDSAISTSFFSWQNFVTGSSTIKLVTSQWKPSNNGTDLGKREGQTLQRIYYTPMSKAAEFNWDPALGIIEEPFVASAPALTLSFTAVFVMIFCILLF